MFQCGLHFKTWYMTYSWPVILSGLLYFWLKISFLRGIIYPIGYEKRTKETGWSKVPFLARFFMVWIWPMSRSVFLYGTLKNWKAHFTQNQGTFYAQTVCAMEHFKICIKFFMHSAKVFFVMKTLFDLRNLLVTQNLVFQCSRIIPQQNLQLWEFQNSFVSPSKTNRND